MSRPEKLWNRNFTLLWQAQTISRLGAQGSIVAILFLVKHLTDSATIMGVLQMVATLPAILIGPLAGMLADRASRRMILVISDGLRAVLATALALIVFYQFENTWFLIAALFVVSILNALLATFFEPAFSAALPDLVPREKLSAANALGQLSFQLAIFIGQGLGGTLYRLLGAPALFLINGVAYLYSSASESLSKIPQKLPEHNASVKAQYSTYRQDFLEGVSYAWGRRGLKELVLISAGLTFFTAPVIILLPFYIEDVLGVAVDWYGFLLAAYGLGTLAGYFAAGALSLSGQVRGQVMLLFIILESLGYGLLGLVTQPLLAVALAAVGGFTGGFVMVNITTLLQLTTPGEIRGRVFGLLGTISAALSPMAMGLAGVVADLMDQNIPAIYMACGAAMVLLSIIVSLRPDFKALLAYEIADPSQASSTPEPGLLNAKEGL